jgi:predicted dehydrogenase
VVDPREGGGRLIGEVCHMVDLLVHLTGQHVATVFAQPGTGAGDDMMLTLRFADGSLGTIVYASGGNSGMPKESVEVLGGGVSAVLDDFRRLRIWRGGREQRFGSRLSPQDKGHRAELAAFVDAVRRGGPSPIDPADAEHVTHVTFAALESSRAGVPVDL